MKITMYELLGMVKDEKAPKKIKYEDDIYELTNLENDYYCKFNGNWFTSQICSLGSLNDEVQILDDEEKKIPEKLKIEQDTPSSNYYIRNENGTKCALTKHSKMIAETLNQLIDYLEKQRKGE